MSCTAGSLEGINLRLTFLSADDQIKYLVPGLFVLTVLAWFLPELMHSANGYKRLCVRNFFYVLTLLSLGFSLIYCYI